MNKDFMGLAWLYFLLITMFPLNSFATESFLDYLSQVDDSPRLSFWMEYQSSDDDSTDFYMEMGLPVNPENRLQIGIGESQLHDENQGIDTSNYSIQLVHQTPGNVDLGIGYSYWGNDDELWTETVELLMAIHGDNFSIQIQPRFSKLNIYTVPIMGTRRLGDTDSEGWGISFNYYGLKNWLLTISGTDYEYDADLTKLNTLLSQFVFSNTTLLLSDSFLEKSTTLEIKKQFNTFDLGFAVSQSTSAIDHSEIDHNALNLEWFTSKDYSLFFETGSVLPEFGNSSKYISMGIGALW